MLPDHALAGGADRWSASPADGSDQEPVTAPDIDLQALTQKVYDLLKRELRLDRERLGQIRYR